MGCSCWVGWVNRSVGHLGDWVSVAGSIGTVDVDGDVGMVDVGWLIRLVKEWCAGVGGEQVVGTGCNPWFLW